MTLGELRNIVNLYSILSDDTVIDIEVQDELGSKTYDIESAFTPNSKTKTITLYAKD